MATTNCTAIVNPRAQRGLRIAERHRLKPSGNVWIVPSESQRGRYKVDPTAGRCTCPDSEIRQEKCKHLWAVELTIRRETTRTEETVTVNGKTTKAIKETVTTVKTARVTYPQVWPAYNAAQTTEKATFQVLLSDLCRGIPEPVQTSGRPRLPLADMVFAITFKVYSGFSGRRFMCDLADAHTRGYLSRLPHFNSLFNYLDMPELTPILHGLIAESSLPLKALESNFAVDSTGFGTTGTVTWFNKRYGHDQDNADWIKLHFMTGVTTNVITSVEISGRYDHDGPFMPGLIEATPRTFVLREVSADKAYSSIKNLQTINDRGATPYVPFKVRATGESKSDLWNRLWGYYTYQRDEFLARYHQRSNAESTVSMIKAKFGGKLRSKSRVGQINEALCKVLAHNICVLVQSIHEFGITASFCAESAAAQEVSV